jgi:hypothetical protein
VVLMVSPFAENKKAARSERLRVKVKTCQETETHPTPLGSRQQQHRRAEAKVTSAELGRSTDMISSAVRWDTGPLVTN